MSLVIAQNQLLSPAPQAPGQPNCCTRGFGKIWSLVSGGTEGLKVSLKIAQFGSMAAEALFSRRSPAFARACNFLSARSASTRFFVENTDFIEDWSISAQDRENARRNSAFEGNYQSGYLNTAGSVLAVSADVFNRVSNLFTPVLWVIDNGLVQLGQRVTRIVSIAGTASLLLYYGLEVASRLALQKLLTDTLVQRRAELSQQLGQRGISVLQSLDQRLPQADAGRWGEVISEEMQRQQFNLVDQGRIHRFYQDRQKCDFETNKNWAVIAMSVSFVALTAISGLVVSASIAYIATFGLMHAAFCVLKFSYNTNTAGNWTPRIINQ